MLGYGLKEVYTRFYMITLLEDARFRDKLLLGHLMVLQRRIQDLEKGGGGVI